MKKFGFLSLGLIGGSIAMAIKNARPEATIVAYARRQETIDEALSLHIIDEGTTTIDDTFKDCDLIFLCAPVSTNNEFAAKLKNIISSTTILTDVGSVKGSIHKTIHELKLDSQFIGGHPMAGSEKTGLSNANATLLENAYYILTPTKKVPKQKVDEYYELVKEIKALPLILTNEEHDFATAGISHVPHMIAAALVNLVHDNDNENQIMKQIAAGGFKDITRIASSSPEMWEAISLSNSENISNLLDEYILSLKNISENIRNKKEGFVFDLFKESKEYRDSFINQARGPIKKVYGCYVDIPDEAGTLAKVALLLSNRNISIKNIGIVHNRDFEEGVLSIEFYNEKATENAIMELRSLNYKVYERK